MNYKKSICLLTSFESLNVQYHIQKNLYNFIAEKFDEFYFINIDNLQFFAKLKKYNFSDEIQNRPKNIILINPNNSKEFKNFIENKILIAINNFGKNFKDLKIHLLIKKKNIFQIEFKNIGNLQMRQLVSKKHFFLALNYLILNRFFRKITTFLSFLGLVNKIDISFISNKKIIDSLNKNRFKKFLYENELLFTKKFCLVNSKFFDEININNKNISNKYIVHLDYYLNYNHETELRGYLDQSTIKKHHNAVYNFLSIAQKKLGKEAIICIHPSYPTEYFRNFYKDLKIIKYRTAELINDAELVTFFDSSAIVNAILLKKKILLLSSKFMGQNEKLHTEVYKKRLGLTKVQLDEFKEENFDEIYNKSFINEDLFKNFISNYLFFDNKEKGSTKIVNTIKEKYF
jgi:hypothetical protein